MDQQQQPLLQAFLICALTLIVVACANRVPLTGGEKDTQPPQLDTLRSTPNYQVNFKKQEIVLYFDEWVNLKDVFNQVVVSPPLAKRPIIERRKKSIHFRFDEEESLRDSATYVINFGTAIQDITENNPATIVYVFSTGPFIDSLSVSGSVVDAFTEKPVEKALVMLYENTADSVVRTERPFYFARTDSEGKFVISNVKAGKFKAVALVDDNLNYKYDGQKEKIGFVDTLLSVSPLPKVPPADTLTTDSLNAFSDLPVAWPTASSGTQVFIKLFQEEVPLLLKDKETRTYGQIQLVFSRQPDTVSITHDDLGQKVLIEPRSDTVVVWYDLPNDTIWNLYAHYDPEKTDTIEVDVLSRSLFLSSASLKLEGPQPTKTEEIHPDTSLALTFNYPIETFVGEGFILVNDSTGVPLKVNVRRDADNPRRLWVQSAWKEGQNFSLSLLPGSVTSFFGFSNADTLKLKVKTLLRKEFGSLTLRVKSLSAEKHYVIRLLSNEKQVFSIPVSGKEAVDVKRPALTPGTYELEIIEDLDANGKWTTGNYSEHRQPEPLFRKSLEALRANWELDVTVEPTFR